MLFVGDDWAEDHHDIELQDEAGRVLGRAKVPERSHACCTMTSTDTTAMLNRLLVLHHRSLPMYLSYAKPWTRPGWESAGQTLELIVAAQRSLVDRLGEMILENGGTLEFGRFPFAYTALHDLSFDFLVRKMIEHQQLVIPEIEREANAVLSRMTDGRLNVKLETQRDARSGGGTIETLDIELLPRFDTVHPPKFCRICSTRK